MRGGCRIPDRIKTGEIRSPLFELKRVPVVFELFGCVAGAMKGPTGTHVVAKGKAEAGSAAEQGYTLRITDKAVDVEAPNSQGLFYAMQTLRQLIPSSEKGADAAVELQALNITVSPRFTWRGLHLDVSRHSSPRRR